MRVSRDYLTAGSYTASANYHNSEGDLVESSTFFINVEEVTPPPFTFSNNDSWAIIDNSGSLASADSTTPFNFGDFLTQPAVATDNNTEYEVNQFNWSTNDTARFTSRFQTRAGHSYDWTSTDPTATILVTGMGNAEITPGPNGFGWHRITNIETNDTTGKVYTVSKIFYIHEGSDLPEGNTLDFGYSQGDFKQNASHISPNSGAPPP